LRYLEESAEKVRHLAIGIWHLANPVLAAFHVLSQDCVDRRVIAFAGFAKERNDIGIKAQGNLLLPARPKYCIRKKVRAKPGNVRIVDVRVLRGINPLPIGSGPSFRTLCVQVGFLFHKSIVVTFVVTPQA
jgi:hypothetical protein